MRRLECTDYDACLTAAAMDGRRAFDCAGCPAHGNRTEPQLTGKENNMPKDGKKNRLIDLNNHLFEQMERLNDDELKGDGLKEEILRAKAMSFVASQIIGSARLALDAERAISEGRVKNSPRMLESGD
jgi:hypothetical protein